MSVESIETEGVSSSGLHEIVEEKSIEWNGRNVQLHPNIIAGIEAISIKELKGNPNIHCCSGSATVSASTDTDGNSEVATGVEVANEEGNVSFGVEGTVSQDSSGETSAEAKANFTVTW